MHKYFHDFFLQSPIALLITFLNIRGADEIKTPTAKSRHPLKSEIVSWRLAVKPPALLPSKETTPSPNKHKAITGHLVHVQHSIRVGKRKVRHRFLLPEKSETKQYRCSIHLSNWEYSLNAISFQLCTHKVPAVLTVTFRRKRKVTGLCAVPIT